MVNDSNIITIDSIESKMKVNKFSGNHSQKTQESTDNLAVLNEGTITQNGVTIEIENGVASVSGTNTSEEASYIDVGTVYLYAGQTYYFRKETGSMGGGYSIYKNGKTIWFSDSGESSNAITETGEWTIRYSLGAGASPTGTFKIGIYKTSGTEWVQGKKALPSMEYPSKVKAVGDNVNILPNNAVSTSHNGVNYTINEDGSIYAVGTATSNSQVILAGQLTATEEVFKFKKGIQYKNVGNVRITYRKTDGDYGQITPSSILVPEEDISIGCLYIEVIKDYSVDVLYYPKLVEYYEGMDESYSPYGQGSVEVKKINKNFYKLDIEGVSRSGVDYTTRNGTVTAKRTATAESGSYFNTNRTKLPAGTYIISGIDDTFVFANARINVFIADTSNGEAAQITTLHSTRLSYKYTSDKPFYLSFSVVITGATAVNDTFIFKPQAEKNVATDFEEHKEQSLVLDIQKPMLRGDYFVKEADGWKEVHGFDYVDTKNVETLEVNLSTSSPQAEGFYRYNINLGLNNRKSGWNLKLICTHFENKNVRWNTTLDGICGWENGYNLCIGTHDENYDTADRMKTFLQNNDVGIYYELATPTKLPCTESQITVLNQLQNIILYDDTTNIILPDVYPILDYDVSKIIDTTTTFEASLDSNGYFVVPDYDIKCLVSYSESDIPSMPEAVETAVSVPGRDGDIPLNTTYNPISFNIVCYTEDNLTPEEKYAEETKMNKFLNSIKNNTIKLKLESKGKYYDVKYNGQLTTINYPKHLQFSIPLKSSSSYAKDIDEYYILGNGEEESDTIKEVGAVFVIEGPAQTPKISLNDYEMFYDNVLLSNTKLVIDSNKSTVTMINREGTATNAMRYYNHEFPKIQNGNNVLKVLSGIDEDRQVNVRWFDLKL